MGPCRRADAALVRYFDRKASHQRHKASTAPRAMNLAARENRFPRADFIRRAPGASDPARHRAVDRRPVGIKSGGVND
jgi:hypothetical protein